MLLPRFKPISQGLIGLAILFLLAACGDSEMTDLTDFVKKLKEKKNSDVDPLPEFKHIPSYFYEVDKMRDPFMPFLEARVQGPIEDTGSKQTVKKDCPRPDPYRIKVGLELLPLDTIRMVGTLEDQDGTLWGLITTNDGTIYRVRPGDYLGVNSGKIIGVYEDRIELLELVPDKEGCFTELPNQIVLSGE